MVRNPGTVHLVRSEVVAANERLSVAQQVREFRFMERQFTDNDEELAPTMPLRRHVVERIYGPLIDAVDEC